MKTLFSASGLLFLGATIGIASTLGVQQLIGNENRLQSKFNKPKIAQQDPSQNETVPPFSIPFFSDSFKEFQKMRESMLNGFDSVSGQDDFFQDLSSNFSIPSFPSNSIDILQKEDDKFIIYEVKGEGIDTNSINIEVTDGLVNINGRVDQKKTEEKDGQSSSVTMTSNFSQSFSIPEGVDTNDVKMEQVNDKIIIKFPKFKSSTI